MSEEITVKADIARTLGLHYTTISRLIKAVEDKMSKGKTRPLLRSLKRTVLRRDHFYSPSRTKHCLTSG